MLGQDVLTQEEFDTHMADDFNPLQQEVDSLRSKIQMMKLIAFSSLVISVASLILSLRSAM